MIEADTTMVNKIENNDYKVESWNKGKLINHHNLKHLVVFVYIRSPYFQLVHLEGIMHIVNGTTLGKKKFDSTR